MKRHPPEDRFGEGDPGPLFRAQPVALARQSGHAAARAAASRASRVDPCWKQEAIAAVREYAVGHRRFLAEQVGIVFPEGADHRSSGHIMREAERLGYVRPDGFAPTVSSRGSPKVAWWSLIFEEAR